MDRLKVGIYGYGKMGALRADVISKFSFVDIAAVYDIDSGRAESPGELPFVSSEEDFWSADIDCIFICAYTAQAALTTARALSKGLHVFCEKPPAVTYEELLVVKAARQTDQQVLKYGFNHRYHYSVMKAKEILSSPDIGNVVVVRGVYGKAGSIDFSENWRNYKKYSGGGILIDQGIHLIDLIIYLLGAPPKVHSSLVTTAFWDIECEDNAMMLMQGAKGELVSLHSSATQWRHKFNLEIICERGYLVLDGILSQTLSYAPEKLIIGYREHEDIYTGMGKPRETIYEFGKDDSWAMEVEEFFGAIRSDKPIKQGTFEQAEAVMKILSDVYAAI